MQKAINFWQAWNKGQPFNPLDIEPTARPPGTILMSYPFGFTLDYRGFHFRSVFLPILSVAFAAYLAAGSTLHRPGSWKVASTALLFTSLPMFYHLDMVETFPEPVRWGLVDNFQAGIAAIATAAVIRSLNNTSIFWLISGWILAVLTLFIKPSGLMVMALLAVSWFALISLEIKRAREQGNITRSLSGYLRWGCLSAIVIYGTAIALCTLSKYISQENLSFAQQALIIMKSVLAVSFGELLLWGHASSGEAIVIWSAGILICLLTTASVSKRESGVGIPTRIKALIFVCFSIWGIGAWYWLVAQSGGNQIRYFYPFMLMGFVMLIPVATHAWEKSPRMVGALILIVSVFPAVNLAALLIQDVPSEKWQKITGVNVAVGKGKDVVAQANDFIQKLRSEQARPKLYSFASGISATVFENVGMYEEMINPDQPTFTVQRPQDWIAGFAVRENVLLTSEYILIRKMDEKIAHSQMMARHIATFEDESNIFQAWLNGLSKGAGIEILSESNELRLLRIYDRFLFREQLYKFVASHSWRDEFVLANEPVWWGAAEIKKDKSTELSNISFSGNYEIHSLKLVRLNEGIKVEVWWKSKPNLDAKRIMFFHIVDDEGNIIYNRDFPLYPYEPFESDREWRHDTVDFPFALSNKRSTGLAFGVYNQGTGDLLAADFDAKSKRDWNGLRILVPIAKEESK